MHAAYKMLMMNTDILSIVQKVHFLCLLFFPVENILFLKPEQEKDKTYFIDKDVSFNY